MNISAENTLALFKNQHPQNISLEGDWRVSLSEIENGVVVTTQGLEWRLFIDLQYKKLLVQNIHTISIQLICETGNLVSFFGTGQVVLTLKFKKLEWMIITPNKCIYPIFPAARDNDAVELVH